MTKSSVSAIILAGGRAQRMGELDKGLQLLHGKPLVNWVAERVSPQVDEILVSANRNLECYAELGYAVLTDDSPDFLGPLAGLHRGMAVARGPLWLSAPCDTPFLPHDLVLRLRTALVDGDAEIAVASAEGDIHPVICLGRVNLCHGLGKFIASGGRRVGEWQTGLRRVVVPFSDPQLFLNINTLTELDAVASARRY